ncbi:hypothetical protein GSI_12281 [Ganoderma sinense ZZ0214-1]|uniref:Uncharacterized protein n=1 Tax=Ganoderma sinense ZZ0214-1 TaxID=1077348 RepID=A0A2G8RYC5_9APHY|nr:hypothetical protein GSI_12281 [Ganoderma sinense ZZ0214-1]
MSSNSTSSTPTLVDTSKVEETPLPPPLEDLRRDREFWIEDGNLILVAKDVAFRIYRCTVDGLDPSPDPLAEVQEKASIPLQTDDEDEHTAEELSTLAQLSHKYHIQDVQEQALESLHKRYTDDFDEWRFSVGKFVARPKASGSLQSDCILH